MDKKQREALVLAMLEKGESYRDIAQKAKEKIKSDVGLWTDPS
jgi:hypothetical protein